MLFSHLFKQPAHPFCRALAAGCPPRGVPWRGSRPGLRSRVPAGAAGARRDAQSQEAAEHHESRAEQGGHLCPGVPRGSQLSTGTLSRFLEAAPAPADPCGFPAATAAKCSGERSQVRQSEDKSELSLAALGLCSGLIGGSGSPPAPLPPTGPGQPSWQPGLAQLLSGSC